MKRPAVRPWHRNRELKEREQSLRNRDLKEREESLRNRRRDRLELMMVIATITSSIATTAAVVVGIYQYGVARDQLVAGDRNRSIQTMTERVGEVCQMLEDSRLDVRIVSRLHEEPNNPQDLEALNRNMDAVVRDVMSAEEENRTYYDADAVTSRRQSEEFRTAYTARYKALRSSVQTVRLWVDGPLLTELDKLDSKGFAILTPSVTLTNRDSPEGYIKGYYNFQMASSYCPWFTEMILNWAKGESVVYPKFDVRPVLSSEEAETIFRTEGHLPIIEPRLR